jgi:SAM-dependent methyltransferase
MATAGLGDRAEQWDDAAATFDDEPDHGLGDPRVRDAWRRLLDDVLPAASSRVLDLGCGTGSLAVLMAAAGHEVTGLDLSAAMLGRAVTKATVAGVGLPTVRADASGPPFRPRSFDVVIARHVLWALDDPARAVERWGELLDGPGLLVLIEGRWSTGAGLTAAEGAAVVRTSRARVDTRPLTDEALWGRPITDERYLLVSSG